MTLVERVIKSAGRNYTIDDDLPPAFLYGELFRRGLELLRGVITFRRMMFRGRCVQIRYKRNLHPASLSSIGAGSIVDASGSRGVRLGRGAKIGRRSIVTTTSQLGKRGVGLTIGAFSGIGDYAHIGCSGGVTIGENVIAGPYVTFHSQEHVVDDLDRPIRSQGTRESEIIIHEDVWIGARVTFLAGAQVGSGSVVAAGSVVRGQFPPNCIIGGVPARVLKHREPC
jgi:UDP-3-O-[3-hydroxymyristoyl] glucosamine N-acyltransferase